MAVVLDQTILYPQGGGQPFDTGSIEAVNETIKFCVTDVRAKSGVVSFKVVTDVMNRKLQFFFWVTHTNCERHSRETKSLGFKLKVEHSS